MTSKCGKNKRVAHEATAECAILTSYVICYWTDARQHGIYLFYILKKQRKNVHDAYNLCVCPPIGHK